MKYLRSYNESKKGPNYKRIIEGDFVIFQGRDAESNDYVTMELANDDDLWFHAKSVPGSHVIIKVRDKLPGDDIIKKAATIAAKNSKSKDEQTQIYYKQTYVLKKKLQIICEFY